MQGDHVTCQATTVTARPLCWLLASNHQRSQCAVPRACRSLFSSTGNSWDMDCRAAGSHSAVSDSLRPHGLRPARLLCPWGFSRQEYWRGSPCPLLGDLLNLRIEPRSPALQADSSPSEPQGKALEHALFLPNSVKYTLQ